MELHYKKRTIYGSHWHAVFFNFSLAQSLREFDKSQLAIYLDARHFRYFAEGQSFTNNTDHAPLFHTITS